MSDVPPTEPTGPQIGADEWVARSGERDESGGGFRGRVLRAFDRVPKPAGLRSRRRGSRAHPASDLAQRQRHLLPPRRHRRARLRPARARPQRRGRIRRSARPRLHRLLRRRGLRLRHALLGQVRTPLAGVAVDHRRGRGLGSPRVPACVAVAAPRGRLPRDRDALLRPDLLRVRDPGVPGVVARPEQGPRARPRELGSHRRTERHCQHRPLPGLRLHCLERARLLLRHAHRCRGRLRGTVARESVTHRPRLARSARRLSRRAGDERADQQAQGHGGRPRRSRRRTGRDDQRGVAPGCLSQRLQHPGPDHHLRNGDPRGRRESCRGHCRCVRRGGPPARRPSSADARSATGRSTGAGCSTAGFS